MQRFSSLARTTCGGTFRGAARPASLRWIGTRHKTSSTSIGNDPDAAMNKSHNDAKESHGKPEPYSEGHSLDRSTHARRHQDAHTEEVTKSAKQRGSGADSGSDLDAVNLAHGTNTGKAEAQRKANATPEGSKFQPGQKGEQVGGNAAPEGKQPGEGMVGTEKAPKTHTSSGLGEFAKNAAGRGPANSFHTYARLRQPVSSTPESAVDKGARDPKDTSVKGAQTAHLPHHHAGEGDSLPAVKNNASLPSKQGDKSASSTGEPATGINSGKGPSAEMRPTGTANSPGSRAVDPVAGIHSPSFSPAAGPQAKYTHVIGTPEPDSHQTAYAYSTTSESGHTPSGAAPRSSTSTSTYPEHTTKGAYKNSAGIGSSNKKIDDSLKGADEMVAQQEVGQAGDDASGRGAAGGRAYTVPPDVGEIEEDTLPKPIKP